MYYLWVGCAFGAVVCKIHSEEFKTLTKAYLLRNERKTAVRRKATRRDGAFEESLPSSE